MATIRKRGSSWQAQVRRVGFPLLTKSFSMKCDAQAWAREREMAIDRAGLPQTVRELKGRTVGDLLKRYEETITSTKRGAEVERYRLKTMQRHNLSKARLAQPLASAVAAYRDDRLKVVKGETVRRELTVLRHCFEIAMKEWGVPLPNNPVKQITLPKPSQAREIRLFEGDEAVLIHESTSPSARYLLPLMKLAIEMGMRRGELLSLRWDHLDLEQGLAYLPITKIGSARAVPLTPVAIALLAGVMRVEERVFPVSADAVRHAWARLRKRAGLDGLRFHDLRHEAVSRFFEIGLSAQEVALISGHRDMRMLARYTHLRPASISDKLANLYSAEPSHPRSENDAESEEPN
ncbi:Site-specific recombinase XerC [Kaistia soli DSM 19436]|uniref:Site-specific recombinase XerC n=2 Tax=Kaistia TaxID=166953 RepID=A0A1M5DWJ3_9HYPH|nr:Site-specific recombinase XerC [Kaistia soli DSM 19436]